MWKPEFTSTTFTIIPVTSQLPVWPAPYSGLAMLVGEPLDKVYLEDRGRDDRITLRCEFRNMDYEHGRLTEVRNDLSNDRL
jgi:hypothetical protein